MYIKQATSAHQSGRYREAKKLYGDAAAGYLEASTRLEDKDPLKEKLNLKAAQAIDAGERLKNALASYDDDGKLVARPPQPAPVVQSTASTHITPLAPPTNDLGVSPPTDDPAMSDPIPPSLSPEPSAASGGGGKGAKITSEELEVLRATSAINGRVFVPWVDADSKENLLVGSKYRNFLLWNELKLNFAPLPAACYSDSDGLLQLAPKQSAAGAKWARPSQISQVLEVLLQCSSLLKSPFLESTDIYAD